MTCDYIHSLITLTSDYALPPQRAARSSSDHTLGFWPSENFPTTISLRKPESMLAFTSRRNLAMRPRNPGRAAEIEERKFLFESTVTH
jgi:hypothetical protein